MNYLFQPCQDMLEEWGTRLGLPVGIPVCVGSYDAHIGAIGGHVSQGVMVKSIGTSTCDIVIGPQVTPGDIETPVDGIAGQVDGSVVPGYIGYEAGQSAYGDFYAWFRNLLLWPVRNMANTIDETILEGIEKNILALLEKEADLIGVSEDAPIALDWINGRRTPNADHTLKGALSGLSLGTDAPSGMQILADVTGKAIHVTSNDQAPAIGAAICASVAAGFYKDIPSAQEVLCARIATVYEPDMERKMIYDRLYARYLELGRFEELQGKSYKDS
ncbi:MAG: FGGY-family carbohydrate kinase [Sphaerochaetaceae bacterium]